MHLKSINMIDLNQKMRLVANVRAHVGSLCPKRVFVFGQLLRDAGFRDRVGGYAHQSGLQSWDPFCWDASLSPTLIGNTLLSG